MIFKNKSNNILKVSSLSDRFVHNFNPETMSIWACPQDMHQCTHNAFTTEYNKGYQVGLVANFVSNQLMIWIFR